MSAPVTFLPVQPGSLPAHGRPVLVRLRNVVVFRPVDSPSTGVLFEGGVYYGFAVCVLSHTTDGFGNKHPTEFREIRIVGDNRRPETGAAHAFKDVDGWAEIL